MRGGNDRRGNSAENGHEPHGEHQRDTSACLHRRMSPASIGSSIGENAGEPSAESNSIISAVGSGWREVQSSVHLLPGAELIATIRTPATPSSVVLISPDVAPSTG